MNLTASLGPRTTALTLAHMLTCLVTVGSAAAAVQVDDEGKLRIHGDFRLRAEADWDSKRVDGTKRDDRSRIRIRARVGLDWKPLDGLSFGLRLRTGSDDSQQSPHITIIDLDDNDTGDAHVNLDKWFVEGTHGGFWGWAGRNDLPFWKQNELLWDDDVTPAGVAGGLARAVGGRGKLSLSTGYFSLPVGMRAYAGNLGLGQFVYALDGAKVDLTVAGGLLRIEANPTDDDAPLLRNGNGLRDYSIAVLSAQVELEAGGRPLTVGADFFDNREDYSASDVFAFANQDETHALVGSIQWGSTSEKGDWLLGYWYADIGALSVNASYAQDDWVRWGSATQTDSSDLEGHELRFACGLGRAGTVVARFYRVESAGGVAVVDGNATPSNEQDGKRFRLDYNVKF